MTLIWLCPKTVYKKTQNCTLTNITTILYIIYRIYCMCICLNASEWTVMVDIVTTLHNNAGRSKTSWWMADGCWWMETVGVIGDASAHGQHQCRGVSASHQTQRFFKMSLKPSARTHTRQALVRDSGCSFTGCPHRQIKAETHRQSGFRLRLRLCKGAVCKSDQEVQVPAWSRGQRSQCLFQTGLFVY